MKNIDLIRLSSVTSSGHFSSTRKNILKDLSADNLSEHNKKYLKDIFDIRSDNNRSLTSCNGDIVNLNYNKDSGVTALVNKNSARDVIEKVNHENLPASLKDISNLEQFNKFLDNVYVKTSVLSNKEIKLEIQPRLLGGMRYEIKKNETLSMIEERHGWRVGILQKLNPSIDPENLEVGDMIDVPHKKTIVKISRGGRYAMCKNDEFWLIEARRGWRRGTIQEFNPDIDESKLQIGDVIKIPTKKKYFKLIGGGQYKKGGPGDSFSIIEGRNSWPPGILIKLNPNMDETKLNKGDIIEVPADRKNYLIEIGADDEIEESKDPFGDDLDDADGAKSNDSDNDKPASIITTDDLDELLISLELKLNIDQKEAVLKNAQFRNSVGVDKIDAIKDAINHVLDFSSFTKDEKLVEQDAFYDLCKLYATEPNAVCISSNVNPYVNPSNVAGVLKIKHRHIGFVFDEGDKVLSEHHIPGHIFYHISDINNKHNDKFFSKYPKDTEDNSVISKIYSTTSHSDSHEKDKLHNDEIIKRMNSGEKDLLDTKVVFLNQEQLDQVLDFVDNFAKDSYILGFNDCTDLGEKLFEIIGIPTSYNFLFDKKELSTIAGQKLNIKYGNSETPITVYGDSIEEIAQKYDVPVERIRKTEPYVVPPSSGLSLATNAKINKEIQDRQYIILPPTDKK